MTDTTPQITAMICSKKGIEYDGTIPVDVCPDAVMPSDPSYIPLRKTGSTYVELKILPVDASAACLSLGGGSLECERGIEVDHNNNFLRRKNGLTFSFAIRPDDLCACGWVGTTITRRNLITCSDCAFISSTPDRNFRGIIPVDDDDPFGPGQESIYTVTDPECLPGEQLLLNWYIRMGDSIHKEQVGGVNFHTPAFSGGRITDIIDPDSPTRQLVVEVFGEGTLTLTPSDYTDYTVGSWVYLMRCTSSDAFGTDRQSAYQIDSSTGGTGGDISSGILRLVNEIRVDHGLVQLTTNSLLTKSSSGHAADMAENDFLSHTGSDGSAPIDRITRAGYLDGVGETVEVKTAENVAMGATSAQEVMDRWMRSPGHRANILDPMFREIGIAVDYADQEWAIPEGKPYYVQNFGYRSDIAPDVTQYRPVPIVFQPNGLLVDTSTWTPTIELDLVGNFERDFEAGYLEATVSKVTQPEPGGAYGTADITITTPGALYGTTYNSIPILYHCPSRQTTTADGHKAFYSGDPVIVFNESGDKAMPSAADLSVVGLKDGIRPCFDCIVVARLYSRINDDYQYVFVELSGYTTAVVYKVYDGNGDEIPQPFWGNAHDPADVALQNGLVNAAAEVNSGARYRNETTWVGPSSYNYRFDFRDENTSVALSSIIHDPWGVYDGFDVGFFKAPTYIGLPDDGTWLFDAGESHCKLAYTVVHGRWMEFAIYRAETAFGNGTPVQVFPRMADNCWWPCSYQIGDIFQRNSLSTAYGAGNVSQLYAGKGIAILHYKARELFHHWDPALSIDDDVMAQSKSAFMVQSNPEEGGEFHYRWSSFQAHDIMTEDWLYTRFGTTRAAVENTIHDWGLIKAGRVLVDDPDLADCYDKIGLQISNVYV